MTFQQNWIKLIPDEVEKVPNEEGVYLLGSKEETSITRVVQIGRASKLQKELREILARNGGRKCKANFFVYNVTANSRELELLTRSFFRS